MRGALSSGESPRAKLSGQDLCCVILFALTCGQAGSEGDTPTTAGPNQVIFKAEGSWKSYIGLLVMGGDGALVYQFRALPWDMATS